MALDLPQSCNCNHGRTAAGMGSRKGAGEIKPNTTNDIEDRMSTKKAGRPLEAEIVAALGTADLLGVTAKTVAARIGRHHVRVSQDLALMVERGLSSSKSTAETSSIALRGSNLKRHARLSSRC